MDNILCILACHTNNNLKFKSTINNIKYLLELCNKLVIIDSEECKKYDIKNKIKNNNIEIIYIKNNGLLCQGKWLYYFNNYDYSIYNKFILTNDSFLITESLMNFKNLINKNDIELFSYLASNEIKYHYTDFLRCYNKVGIKILLKYYIKNKDIVFNYDMIVNIYEINSTYIFKNKKVLFESINNYYGNINFDNKYLEDLLYNNNFNIIKIRYLKDIIINNNFNPLIYNKYKDLQHFNDHELLIHLETYGFNENRIFKATDKTKLPDFFEEYFEKFDLFDIID